ncbi:hypothetical protein D3C76_879570 [compost metagenome]
MEHSPIQELAANFRGALQQPETVWVDQLQWQQFGQLRSTFGILPVDANCELALPFTRYPQVAGASRRQLDLAKHGARWLLVLDDGVKTRTAEGPRQPKQVHSFKHTGLAAAISTVEDVDAGRR